jgi:acylphosphatase
MRDDRTEDHMGEMARAHVIISGRVQGVFFRMETKRAADKHGVCGWVRNTRDGTVEALFEGSKEQVDSAIEWCKKGPPLAQVRDLSVEWEDYRGEPGEFAIRY